MRTLVKLRAERDFAYDNTYNHKLQGRLYNDLRDNGYGAVLDEGPKTFSYSNIFPPRDAEAGDSRSLIFAASDQDLVTSVAYGLCSEPEVNIGEMPLRAEEAFTLDPKVGESGSLTTGTPIVIRFGTETAAEYGIETEYDRTYWRPEHGMDLFFDSLYGNLQKKYERVYDESAPSPPYFSGYSFQKVVPKPVTYADGDVTYVGTEWEFDYEIRSAAHRRILNLALDAGLGELNGLGFGFINRTEDI
ncbi:CRISPR-associated endoribonuclease Cas6 [Haloferax prahovense]|uniref:CRISPR-associated endoribonuclease Cas6 n=1 Tax=Haloferax prahovense TaxID=381852 RepID=UPI000679E81D|nr:CRISPR-associated endoribonuclease Cas6 [Haloferax prahovense]